MENANPANVPARQVRSAQDSNEIQLVNKQQDNSIIRAGQQPTAVRTPALPPGVLHAVKVIAFN